MLLFEFSLTTANGDANPMSFEDDIDCDRRNRCADDVVDSRWLLMMMTVSN
jgi:hypothetical protein